jgi:26S proteasome regulatory subunit N1
MIKTEVAGATSSMTSVPKPLKFLTPLYQKLTEIYAAYSGADAFKHQLADLCSVIGMVAAPEESSDMLDYCLKGTLKDLISWGHEYLRALSGQIGVQYDKRVADGTPTANLLELVDIIVPEFINHNEEPEAVDLMMETESLGKLNSFCNARNYDRVCRYLCACSQYAADTEEMKQSYTTAYQIYKTQRKYCEALQVAQKMNDMELITEIMTACPDPIERKQMAFMLGR